MEVVQVQPRDFYLYYINVPTKGTCIRWTFTTKKNNISFGLYRRLGHTLPSSSDVVLKAQSVIRPLRKRSETDSIVHDHENEMSSIYSRPRSKSIASEKLKEAESFVEVIPIEHVNSVKAKIEGSYTANEPGSYILVFDNTFSKNTPKIVTFSVALVDPRVEQTLEQQQCDISGWLLKKRRKKLQGWAKRWFELSNTGVLSYSTTPEGVTRGSIQILLSTITLNPKQRIIHIDSGSTLYHLRCQTDQDYTNWTAAFKVYKEKEPVPVIIDDNVPSDLDYAGADRICSEIDKGLGLADSLYSAMALHERNTQHYKNDGRAMDSAMCEESQHIYYMVQKQASQWKRLKELMQRMLQADASLLQLSRVQSNSKISSHLKPDYGNDDTHSSRNSIMSDQFYDAESAILTFDEDEDDYAVGIVSGSSSTYTTEEEQERHLSEENVSSEESVGFNIDKEPMNFHRRQILPAKSSNDGVSPLAIFRKNIGKDLSQIAMPVSMNEPLSMLEKACEDLEYSELLDQAAGCSDSIDRLKYVAVFAISSYASSQWRSGRKPFNPIMSETYECIRPDKGFRFISEKVSHHPLIIACHAESKRYKYWTSTKVKSKFWGKSMEFMTEGTFHVLLTETGDHFTFSKPSSWMRNMIAGEKYIEHVGEVKLKNHNTGDYAMISFKEGTGRGIFSAPKDKNNVVCTLYNQQDVKCKRLVGKWSGHISEDINMEGHTFSVLWKVTPPRNPDFEKYYGFTEFAVELNEITPIEETKLPKTDSRYRPDQRLYEEGHSEEAEKEKLRIEAKQRETRKVIADQGLTWEPCWFKLETDDYTETSLHPEPMDVPYTWQFSGEYWKIRESRQWPKNQPDLW